MGWFLVCGFGVCVGLLFAWVSYGGLLIVLLWADHDVCCLCCCGLLLV